MSPRRIIIRRWRNPPDPHKRPAFHSNLFLPYKKKRQSPASPALRQRKNTTQNPKYQTMEDRDHFDRLPDCLLLDILDRVSDAKSLVRCLSLSSRFRSLVPLATSLHLLVDRVVPPSPDAPSPFISLFESFAAFLNLFFPLSLPPPSYSPASVLRGFRCIQDLDIRLPSPMTLDGNSGTFIRYRATFGETLEKCVILAGFKKKEEKEGDEGEATKATDEGEEEEEVKARVFWVIRALVDACQRHDYASRELVREHLGLLRLRMSDAGGEGVVEMDERGLEDCRKRAVPREGCRVPRVRMQMWYGRKTEVRCHGGAFEGATLVVVRTVRDGTRDTEDGDEAVMATDAFGADSRYKDAVGALTKSRSYSLEMNSFLI